MGAADQRARIWNVWFSANYYIDNEFPEKTRSFGQTRANKECVSFLNPR